MKKHNKQASLDYQAIKLQKACSGNISILTAYAFLETAYNLGRQSVNSEVVKAINKNTGYKFRKISEIKKDLKV